ELESGVDALGEQCAHLRRDLAAVEDRVVDAALRQRSESLTPASGGENRRPHLAGQGGGGEPNRGGPASDEQALSALQIESDSQDRKSTRLNSSHTEIYTLSLHDALPICRPHLAGQGGGGEPNRGGPASDEQALSALQIESDS